MSDYDWGEPYDDWEDAPGDNVPQPRSAAIRGAVQGRMRKSSVKQRPIGHGVQKNQKRILAQQKRRTVLEMRKAGASFPQIAQAVGYADEGGAYKAYRKAMGEVIQEPVAELKTMQIERLNHMLVAIWQRVQQGDLGAMNMALSIMNKMDALAGTEAAQRIEIDSVTQGAVLVVDGSKDDYIAALKKMSGAGIQPDGTNSRTPQQAAAAALNPGQVQNRYPPGMGQPDAAVITLEDPTEEERLEQIVDAVLVDDEPAPAVPTKKAFSWGTDPVVKVRPKDER